MLYATTRNKNDVHTAYRVIHQDCAQDGGLFLPFSMPHLEDSEIRALKDRSFGDNVAQILNLFFSAGLTGWDVEFAIGRNAAQNVTINNRLVLCECWHNSHWRYEYIVQMLSDRLRKEGNGEVPTNWVRMAISVAVLFGIYGNLLEQEQVSQQATVDIAVAVGDFSMPMAAWYAREMGLPVANIVCGCNANGAVWDLLHHGQMGTGGIAAKTITPEADVVVPRNPERLVYETLGMEETARYLDCCRTGSIYAVAEETLEQLRAGLFAAVISDDRVNSVIHSVYRTSNSSLLDYRAKTGESRPALLLSERSPICDRDQVAKAMQVPVAELIKRINIS